MSEPRTAHEPSLLDEEILREPPKRERIAVRLERRVKGAAASVWARPLVRRTLSVTLGVALGASALAVVLALRPVPQPDYQAGDMDDLFNYTLLTDEFNRLSVDERLELLAQLRDRLGSMDADQSVLLAAFAARIKGEMREQLTENVARLGVDIVDLHAADYDPTAPPDVRREYLLTAFVDLHKKMSALEGRDDEGMSDEDRLQEGFDQARRDVEMLDEADISGEQAGELFRFTNTVMGRHASPHEKARAAVFMRDMTRVLRSGGGAP